MESRVAAVFGEYYSKNIFRDQFRYHYYYYYYRGALYHKDSGRPPQIICHCRVVEFPHDVTARLVMILLTCLPKAIKVSPAPPFPWEAEPTSGTTRPSRTVWANATDGAPVVPVPPRAPS